MKRLAISLLTLLLLIPTACREKKNAAPDEAAGPPAGRPEDLTPTQERRTHDLIGRLTSNHRAVRWHALGQLNAPGPERLARIERVVDVFRKAFGELTPNARGIFARRVVPHLPQDVVGPFLLGEFRKGLPVHREYERLDAVVRQQEDTFEIGLARERLDEKHDWWLWCLRALGEAHYGPAYDDVLTVILEMEPESNFMTHAPASELYRIDAKRATANFTQLLRKSEVKDKIKALRAFSQIGKLPKWTVLRGILEQPDKRLHDRAAPLAQQLERKDLPLILRLLSSPSVGMQHTAEGRLGKLGFLTYKEMSELRARGKVPADRADFWRTWWKDRQALSEAELRKRGFKRLLAEAKTALDTRTISNLSVYGDRDEVYVVLRRALARKDERLRDAVTNCLRAIIRDGQKKGVDFFLEQFAAGPPNRSYYLAGALVESKDPGIAPALFEVLPLHPDNPKPWQEAVLRALNVVADKRVLAEVLNLVITHHCGVTALANIPGAETALPALLEALVKQENPGKPYAIRWAIEILADESIAPELTRLLPLVPETDQEPYRMGRRGCMLQLMARFPDPAAKPMLIKMMKHPDPWCRILTARVLARLGDTSAVPTLIEDVLGFKNVGPGAYGELFREIDAPGVPKKVIVLYRQWRGDERLRVLKVIAEHRDAAYVDFLGTLLDDRDARVRRLAAGTLGDIVLRADPKAETRLVSLRGKDLTPLRGLLLWLFKGQVLREEDRLRWGREPFATLPGAVLSVSPYEYVLFKAAEERLQWFSMKRKEMSEHSTGSLRSLGDGDAAGSLKWIEHRDYLRIHVGTQGRGVHYLFRKDKDKWEPVGVVSEGIS